MWKFNEKEKLLILGALLFFIFLIKIMPSIFDDKKPSSQISNSNQISTIQNKEIENVSSSSSSKSNIHSDLNSCASLRSRFQSCVSRSYRGLECFPGTDIVLPPRCR